MKKIQILYNFMLLAMCVDHISISTQMLLIVKSHRYCFLLKSSAQHPCVLLNGNLGVTKFMESTKDPSHETSWVENFQVETKDFQKRELIVLFYIQSFNVMLLPRQRKAYGFLYIFYSFSLAQQKLLRLTHRSWHLKRKFSHAKYRK